MTDEQPERRPTEATPQPSTTWADLIESQRLKHEMAPNEFARHLDKGSPTKVSSGVMTKWRDGSLIAGADTVIHVAVRLEIPVTTALRAAKHAGLADYIESVTARAGTGPEYLEPLIARVRAITDGLTDEQRAEVERQMLVNVADAFTLAEVKAQRIRNATADTSNGSRNAS